MRLLRKYTSVAANSILESVIALTIISICMFIAVMVYATVFNTRSSVRFYNTQNEMNEMFYLLEVREDSVVEYSRQELKIEAAQDHMTKQYKLHYADSSKINVDRTYYISTNE